MLRKLIGEAKLLSSQLLLSARSRAMHVAKMSILSQMQHEYKDKNGQGQ
jgi:hypothetical protein